MSALDQRLGEYLAVRRALGYKLDRAGKLLAQFLAWLDERGAGTITTELALEWATLPPASASNWHWQRLSVIRGFAAHLHAIDPACEVPGADLLAWRPRRAIPYLYREQEVAALMAAAATLGSPHRAATLRTLIGLLSVTGLRVGEAIRLDRSDIDRSHDLLVIRDSKFGKSRELALHPTATCALGRYLRRADRPVQAATTPAVFVSAAGTRLLYCNVHNTFGRLLRSAGIEPRSTGRRPRLHHLRHSFAVATVLDAYRSGDDVGARLPLLSTYLGHVNPGSTYWYLRPPQSCSPWPGNDSRTTWKETGDERARPDATGVLHRPADRPAPGQPAHDRRLPRHDPAAARVHRQANRQTALGAGHR